MNVYHCAMFAMDILTVNRTAWMRYYAVKSEFCFQICILYRNSHPLLLTVIMIVMIVMMTTMMMMILIIIMIMIVR